MPTESPVGHACSGEPLRALIYPTIGNHEVVQREGDADHERAYREYFGDDRVSYVFESGGIAFVMLNNAGACSVSDDVIRARNAWLRRTLAEHVSRPKIIGCHIPVVPVREEAVLARSFGYRSYQAHDPELLALIDHAACVFHRTSPWALLDHRALGAALPDSG